MLNYNYLTEKLKVVKLPDPQVMLYIRKSVVSSMKINIFNNPLQKGKECPEKKACSVNRSIGLNHNN